MNDHLFHVIKDPVHGTMQFSSTEDAWVKPFINSMNFQRLRHIKQLGLGDYIFPGAVHSRFNHSLGCCYVASQIAHKIGLTPAEQQLVMIASLLHDIGHGPFSHAFEGLFSQKIIRHEDWTPYFLADYDQSFFADYNKRNPSSPLSSEKFTQISNMIMHRPAANQVLADIVSSQLDADRLDYLLRDSHFCGVRYGEFDFPWMLHCMTIVPTETGNRLGITYKGIGAVEHYLMARRLMLRNIYHSQKKLALEYFLVELLITLSRSLSENPIFTDFRSSRLGQFLIAANQFNLTVNKAVDDEHENIKHQFLTQHFYEYKELCDYDVFILIKALSELKTDHPAIQIAKRLHYRQMPKIVRLDQQDTDTLQQQLTTFKNDHPEFHDWQLTLITTPHQAYSGEDNPLFVINEEKRIQPISSFSFMIQAISDKLEHIVFLCIDQAIASDQRIIALLKKLQSS